MNRYEVWVDSPSNEFMTTFATYEQALAAAVMAELLNPEGEVAINDLVAHSTIHSNAACDTPIYPVLLAEHANVPAAG